MTQISKSLFLSAISIAMVLAGVGQSAEKLNISGNLTGLQDGEMITLRMLTGKINGPITTILFDSAVATNGHFHLQGYVPEGPRFFYLGFTGSHRHQTMAFLLDNEQVSISGDLTKMPTGNLRDFVEVQGSESDYLYSTIKYFTNIFYDSRDAKIYLDHIKDSLGSESDLAKAIAKTRNIYLNAFVEFFVNHRHSPAIPFLLHDIDGMVSGDTTFLSKTYNNLDDRSKNSFYGKQVKELVMQLPGHPAPGFASVTLEGQPFSFADFVTKGKYTLVDFWASYCGPCRAENPNLIRLYNKYHEKGFDIVGVSMDTDRNSWKHAVEQDQLPWSQVSDLKGVAGEASLAYDCKTGIPINVLIDSQGKVIARNVFGTDLQQRLNSLFGF